MQYNTLDGKLYLRSNKLGEEAFKQWNERPIPADQPTAFQQWVDHIENDTQATDNIALAVDLTTLMEASILSAERKRPVRLDEIAG